MSARSYASASRCQSYSRTAGALVAILGLVVLVGGWWMGIDPLARVAPALPSMKANAAACFVLIGLSLILATQASSRRTAAGNALGFIVALIGAATLGEYAFGRDLGIDQLLAHDTALGTGTPGRPSPHAAVCFVLGGLALGLINADRRGGFRPFRALFGGFVLSVSLAVIGYLYGVSYLHGVSTVTGMAVHTMVAFVVLAVGVVLASLDREPMATLLGPSPGGTVMRRLVPTVVLITLVIGYIRLEGQRRGLYDSALGTSAFTLATMMLLTAVVLVNARSLNTRVGRDETRLRTVIDSSHEAFIAMDASGEVTDWNPAAEETFGWTRSEAMGRTLAGLVIPAKYRRAHREGLARVQETGERRIIGTHLELEAVHRDGHVFPIELTISALEIDGGHSFSAFLRDISERKELERRQQRQLRRAESAALTDRLTGLPNRRALDEHLEREVALQARMPAPEQGVCLALLDLDSFKEFNDRYGHQGGDRLLRETAAAWRATLRSSDFLARYGGDEFVLVNARSSREETGVVVERLRGLVSEGRTCSAGIACWDGEERTDALIARADAALYEAKRSGRDTVVVA